MDTYWLADAGALRMGCWGCGVEGILGQEGLGMWARIFKDENIYSVGIFVSLVHHCSGRR